MLDAMKIVVEMEEPLTSAQMHEVWRLTVGFARLLDLLCDAARVWRPMHLALVFEMRHVEMGDLALDITIDPES